MQEHQKTRLMISKLISLLEQKTAKLINSLDELESLDEDDIAALVSFFFKYT